MKATFRIRPFRHLIAAYAVNSAGTWLGEIALSILVFNETGSPAAVAAVWVLGLFVPSFAGPPLVSCLERVRPTLVLPTLLAIEAVLFALLTAIVASGFSLPAILVLAAADGVVALAARALLKASLVATTEPRGLLREGNAVLNAVFTACMAIGPVLGGVIVGFASPEAALAIDAVSFALAALLLARSGMPHTEPVEARERGRFRQGLTYVRGHGALRPLLWATGATTLFGAAVLPIEVVLVTDTLGSSEAAYGTVLALWGGGAVAGSTLLLPALRRVPLRALMSGAFALCAVSYVGMGSAGSIELVCAFSLVGGISNGVDGYATLTAVQELTAKEQQARVGGFLEAIVAATTGLGFLAGGAIATFASPRAVYMAAGLGILAVASLLAAPRGLPSRATSWNPSAA